MTDFFGRWLLKQLERRFERLARNNQMMRIVGSKFTIWVTRKIDNE